MISLDELKIFLKIDAWDTSKDDQLNQAIDSAKGFIASYVWYPLELNTAMIAEFCWITSEFYLKRRHINSVTNIQYADDQFNPSWTTYNDTNNQRVFLDKGVVRTRDRIWPFIEITYSFWYDVGSCPDDLKAANLEIASTYYKKMGEIAMQDVNSESVDGDQISFKWIVWTISESSLTILDNYKEYGFSS